MSKSDTQFKPGQSGNPNGRAKQIHTSTELRQRLAKDMPAILETLLKQAKAGDMQAIKIILDRTHPPLKAQSLPVTIPAGTSLTETSSNVVQATLSGQLAPEVSTQLLTVLNESTKLNELAEISERLAQIEARLNK